MIDPTISDILKELNRPQADYVSKPYALTENANVTAAEIEAARDQYVSDLLHAKHIDSHQQQFLAAEILKHLREN
jgi:hypothetical protein